MRLSNAMKFISAGVIVLSMSSQAANALSIGADQLLGTVAPGTPSSEANELIMVNGLLEGWTGVLGYNDGASGVMGNNPNDPQAEVYTLQYSSTTVIPALAPLATMGMPNVITSNPEIDLGSISYDWVLAKWGRDSAVYYIGGLTGAITLTLDGTGWDAEAHGLSHYALFNKQAVPDGGMTLWLLGCAMLGIEALRRRVGR